MATLFDEWSQSEGGSKYNALQGLKRQQSQPVAPTKKKKGFWTDQISTGGGIGGALGGAAAGAAIGSVVPIAGTAVGGLLGALIGGGLGSAAGEAGENAIMGEDLSKNVLKEGLIGGVTSVPIGAGFKLARAGVNATTGLGKKSASDLVQEAGMSTIGKRTVGKMSAAGTVDEAGQAALSRMGNKSSLRGKAADFASKQSDALSIKGLGLAPVADLGKFQSKYGEDVAQVVKRNNLIGRSADEFDPAIGQLHEAFDGVVHAVPNISKSTLTEQLSKVYQPLIDSPVLAKRAKGQQLKDQADAILSSHGDEISAADLNKLRRSFDEEVNYANLVANPTQHSVNKKSADALRRTIQSGADDAGLQVDGKSFKDIGTEISKLRFIQDAAAKRANNGRGSGPLGLRNMLGATAGAGAGGPMGAVAGMATTAAANSPHVIRAGATALDGMATRLGGEGAEQTGRRVGQSLFGTTVRQGGTRYLTGNDIGSQPSSLEEAILARNQLGLAPTAGTEDPSPQEQPTNPFGVSRDEVAQALMGAMRANDKPAIGQLQELYGLVSEYEESQASTAKPMGVEAQKMQNNAGTGLTSLDDLEQIINEDSSVVNRAALPDNALLNTLTGTSKYRAAITNVQDAMTRLRSGASMNEQEAQRFDRMLPRFGDSPEDIKYKLGVFRDYYNTVASQAQNAAPTDFTSALIDKGL